MNESKTDTIANEYLKRPYSFVLTPEAEGGYSVCVLEFPGCFSDGDTPDEAIANILEAARGWLAVSIEHGHEIPEPYDISRCQKEFSRSSEASTLAESVKSLREALSRLEALTPDQVVMMAKPSTIARQNEKNRRQRGASSVAMRKLNQKR